MTTNFEKDMKKKSGKKWLAAVLVVVIAVAVIFGMDLRGAKDITEENSSGETIEVSMEIICDTAAEKNKEKGEVVEYIPEDGVVLKKTEYKIEKDATCADFLKKVTAVEGIHMELEKDNVFGYYLTGLNHLYGGDYGKMSGWLYYVNDEMPMYGIGELKLADGDEVSFKYSCEGGEDLM